MKKIFFITLGCARNLVDSEFAIDKLSKAGYKLEDKAEDAEIGIVNSCGFIKEAKEETISVVLDLIQLKKEGQLKKIILGGCLSQRYGEKLWDELPQIDVLLGINWDDIVDIVKKLEGENKILDVREERKLLPFLPDKRFWLTPLHYAYLKISEGCSNRCSYCAIYKIKGSNKSRPIEEVIQEARILVQRGVKEINIIAQDTTSYGIDIYGSSKLPELLERISQIAGDFWIRLLYVHPARVNSELIQCYKTSDKLCKYIDLPLQHINDDILNAMHRRITKKGIYNLIQTLRKEIRGICFRTTFIVGFPGEGEKEFEELINFIREIKFERLGCFIYSREDGTEAFDFPGQVPKKLKNKRFDILMKTQKDIALEVNNKFLNRELKVIVDSEEKDYYIARTEYDAPEVDGVVYIKKNREVEVGNFSKVIIKGNLGYDLEAEFA